MTETLTIRPSEALKAAPKLTFCFPTYNRAALLKEALRAVLDQIGPEEAAQVEILIMDNASPDDTPQVVEKLNGQSPYLPLRYVRNPENLGLDRNFLKGIGLARGKFVCLLSDDDILLPGAVAKLLEMIHKYPDFDGFCCNIRSFYEDPYKDAPPWLDIKEDVLLRDRNEVLQLVQGHITFMTILVFNKSLISDRLAAGHYADKIGTYFLPSYIFLDVLASGKDFAAVAQIMMAQRVENAHALNFFQVFITELAALMNHAEASGFSRKLIRRIKMDMLIGARHFVARVKIYNRETELWSSRRDGIVQLFRVYKFHPYLWLVVVPLMFFPRSLRPAVHLVRRLLGRAPIEEKKEARQEAPKARAA